MQDHNEGFGDDDSYDCTRSDYYWAVNYMIILELVVKMIIGGGGRDASC